MVHQLPFCGCADDGFRQGRSCQLDFARSRHFGPRTPRSSSFSFKKNDSRLLGCIEEIITNAGQSDRVRRHILSQLISLGRHTITGLLSTQGQLLDDWTADYRLYQSDNCNPEAIFDCVRNELIAQATPDNPLIVALDDTRLRKSGRNTHGVKYTRDPLGPPFHVNFIRAQRFLQLSMAAESPCGDARMVPIDFQHAPTPPKPKHNAGEQAFADYRAQMNATALPKVAAQKICHLREKMNEQGHRDRSMWTVVDGGYTNSNFLKGVHGHCTVIGRIRSDAKLFHLPESSNGKTGRNRVYGEMAPTPNDLRVDETIPWQEVHAHASGSEHCFRVKSLSPLRWRSAGKNYDLKLVVIAPLRYRLRKNGKFLYRQPAYLICTDPNADIKKILQAYLRRWDIEVNFRDEKTLLGVGEAQVRNPESVQKVPALAVSAYATLLVSSIKTFGHNGLPDCLPRPKWQNKKMRRASTQQLINHLRHEIWADSIRFSDFESQKTPYTKSEKRHLPLESALFFCNA